MEERLGIVGTGAIACGLAAVAAERGEVVVLARSAESASRARETVGAGGGSSSLRVETEHDALADATFIVEAIVEDHDAKAQLLGDLHRRTGPDAILATTTSSLSVEALAGAAGRAQRFVGLHVFNPVRKMALIELVVPQAADDGTRERARALCEALGKTAVEVPDVPGFVVNRLLFPYLFAAVSLMETTGLEPDAVDTCMRLGAGHPMGPLALLDLVGLDVAQAIGERLGAVVPLTLRERVADGALGRKASRGFYDYPGSGG